MLDIAIIGGGLAGLSLAQRLSSEPRTITVFEARDRWGGRIFCAPGADGFRYDLGPSWIWPEFQPRLAAMIDGEDIAVYPQWSDGHSLYQSERESPPQAYRDQATYAAARRIQGGAYALIDTLLRQLPQDSLKLNHQLNKLIDCDEYIELHFSSPAGEFSVNAKQVVTTIPPRLLVNTVALEPALDQPLQQAMRDTPTWMAGHAKVLLRYPRAFWREAGLSGNVIAPCQGAILSEVFDAGSNDADHAALSGFFAIPASLRNRYRDDLKALVLEQLLSLFGSEAAQPTHFQVMDWCNEQFTAAMDDANLPASHPQYGHPWLQLDHWNDKLYFCGTETARDFGGYLEGALESAERVSRLLLL